MVELKTCGLIGYNQIQITGLAINNGLLTELDFDI